VAETEEDQIPVSEEHGRPNGRLRQWGRFSLLGIAFVVVGFLGLAMVKRQEGQVSSGLAPDFTLVTFSGETVKLSELRGQVVIVNFWASWCVPCREEAPYLEQTWRKYQDRGVVFIGVDYVDVEGKALAFIKEFNVTYPNGPDIGLHISDAYHMRGVPETYFVARNGELRGVKIGPSKPPELEQKIEELLAESN
jgi:cytochrome c biogenesis protein CcmG/thiol:disulfide interchange protein DsbE